MERAVNLFSCWIMKMQITPGPVLCHRSFILHCIFWVCPVRLDKQVNLLCWVLIWAFKKNKLFTSLTLFYILLFNAFFLTFIDSLVILLVSRSNSSSSCLTPRIAPLKLINSSLKLSACFLTCVHQTKSQRGFKMLCFFRSFLDGKNPSQWLLIYIPSHAFISMLRWAHTHIYMMVHRT